MTQAILPLVAAYVAVAVLLLSLNLTSRWAWPIKAAAIGVTTGFFGLSYIGAVSLLGWPSRSTLPPRFQLLWSKLVEPDKHSGEDGGIFLWLDALDDNNLPLNRPRAYQLRWDPNLAKQVAGAQEKRQSGQDSPVERRKSRRRTKLMSRIPIRSWDHPRPKARKQPAWIPCRSKTTGNACSSRTCPRPSSRTSRHCERLD